jgi:hypothetical protein
VAERRETYGCLRGIRWACTIGAGQAPCEAPCVPIRGTPASRRSHRGDFRRRGRASPHRHCGRIGHSELPRPGRSARRGAPASRGSGYEPQPRDATPRSAFRMPPDDARSMSKAGNAYSIGCKSPQVKKFDLYGDFLCSHFRAQVVSIILAATKDSGRARIPRIPAHSASKTRVNALVLGIQGPQSAALGPRFRGDDGPEVCERTKKPHADMR